MTYHVSIFLILLFKTCQSLVPDNEADANIIKAITANYISIIRYFDNFFDFL
jgi:hypothetical protein